MSYFLLVGCQDALLDKHAAEDTFGDQELQDTGRPVKSLLVGYSFYLTCQLDSFLIQMPFFSLFWDCGVYFWNYILTPSSCLEQVVTSWAFLLVLGALKFLQSSSFLSSWKGIAISASGLAIVTILMQVLIRFSQSERSTPAKVVPSKHKNGGEPSEARPDKQQ